MRQTEWNGRVIKLAVGQGTRWLGSKAKFAYYLLLVAVALAACGTEPPAPTTTPSLTAIPPSATREFRLIPSWTPTISPLPSATSTPRPTATPNMTLRPYLTAQPNYTPHSGEGIATPDPQVSLSWLDRFSFASDDQPILLFEIHYDPLAWQLESILTAGGVGYQLAHRLIDDCVLSQTTGGNATAEMSVEYEDQTLGNTAYYIGQATLDDELAFVTYCTSYADTPTCFIAYPGSSERRCLAEIEGMLAGISFLTNPRYTAAPNQWSCRDELGNPGLCQVSYTLPLNAFSLPAEGDGWAVGEDGLILRQDGTAWRRENSPATTTLYDITFVDGEHGWAAGLGGLIMEWDGASWSVQLPYTAPEDQPGGVSRAVYALDFTTLEDGWAAGSIVYPEGAIQALLMHWKRGNFHPGRSGYHIQPRGPGQHNCNCFHALRTDRRTHRLRHHRRSLQLYLPGSSLTTARRMEFVPMSIAPSVLSGISLPAALRHGS